jgi:pimeloyl-ACP methyl ester carboxylesterase
MLLLHQSPWFMIEFGAVQNALAELGIRSVAVDTPGYGMSDQPTVLPTVGGFADNLVFVLDYLKLGPVVVGAHHTGCAIGTALAARHPTRVSGVVLHGLPLYTPEEYAERQNRKEADRSATADGSQLIKYFKGNVKMDSPGDVEVYTWLTMAGLMVGRDVGHWAINRYDFATDLKSLKMPGLIMTETEDLLHKMDLRAREMRPDFAYAVLAEKDTTGVMVHAKDWANIAAGFIHASVK